MLSKIEFTHIMQKCYTKKYMDVVLSSAKLAVCKQEDVCLTQFFNLINNHYNPRPETPTNRQLNSKQAICAIKLLKYLINCD